MPCAKLTDAYWNARAGAPWRDVLAYFGQWNTVDGRFRLWVQRGVFGRLLNALAADRSGKSRRPMGLSSSSSGWLRPEEGGSSPPEFRQSYADSQW